MTTEMAGMAFDRDHWVLPPAPSAAFGATPAPKVAHLGPTRSEIQSELRRREQEVAQVATSLAESAASVTARVPTRRELRARGRAAVPRRARSDEPRLPRWIAARPSPSRHVRGLAR